MVPIKEMTDVLRVVKDTTGIKRGSWVRIKRSAYKDDIAQVGVASEWAWSWGDVGVVFSRWTTWTRPGIRWCSR